MQLDNVSKSQAEGPKVTVVLQAILNESKNEAESLSFDEVALFVSSSLCA